MVRRVALIGLALIVWSCKSATDTTTAVTTVTAAPTISSFTASPASISAGQNTTLTWTVTGAPTLSINPGFGSVTGASRSASPGTTTIYTLTATNSAGSVTATVTVSVTPLATITSFTATPATITSGQSTMLAWMVNGATTLSLDQGVGAVTGTNKSVTPVGTTTYTLTAANALGTPTTATTTATVIPTVGALALTYVAGSTVKLEQIIGDKDWGDAAKGITTPTASQTATRYNIFANGFGMSFEDNGKMLFLFGDTRSVDPTKVNFRAADPIGYSTSTDPESGLLLNFFTKSDGTPLFVTSSGVNMGPDNIPNSGIRLNNGLFLVVNTGADPSLTDPWQSAYSVLLRFDEAAQTFTTGRTISTLPGGRFVFTSLRASGPDVYTFGLGTYRASDVFLATTPASGFETGTGTRYFAGLVGGQPTWVNSESGAVPIVQDNPLNGPPWPNDNPTIGNVSVVYSTDLALWLMTYDGGRQAGATGAKGVYFTSARQPWGPWAAPQLIFNGLRDNGYGVFIHNPALPPPGDGLNGPTIGSNDPVTTAGGDFAPLLIERFLRVAGDRLKIYYTMSTWNPYTVVKMRSEFKISSP